jgi:hypothetical protein
MGRNPVSINRCDLLTIAAWIVVYGQIDQLGSERTSLTAPVVDAARASLVIGTA